jgi:hypothetical protein
MNRTTALVWKEWRDHRAAAFVFAALVPLVSWPIQRWVFKFGEPEWTWKWILPLCVGIAVAVVAADAFAMDLVTSRMRSFAALPTRLSHHFAARVAFLGLVAAGIAAWTIAANYGILSIWGKPGAAALLFERWDAAALGLAMSAAGAAAVLVFSSLGVGGFRAVLGGALLAGVAFVATDYAFDRLATVPDPWRTKPGCDFLLEWTIAAAALFVAAFVGFVGARADLASRRRGAALVGALLVAAFGLPAGAAAWKAYRGWLISPDDPEITIEAPCVSPDGRHVAVHATKRGPFEGRRAWIVRVDDGRAFDWPRRNELIYGWSKDGFAWAVREQKFTRAEERDHGRLATIETGDTVASVTASDVNSRVEYGWSHGARWTQWLRWNIRPTTKDAPPGSSEWTLWKKDEDPSQGRVVLAKGIPAPTRTVGEALIVTPDNRLALVSLAGGEPRVVAERVRWVHGALAGSPDGRFFIVDVDKRWIVLDSETWMTAAGPLEGTYVSWCAGENHALLCVVGEGGKCERLLDVATGREIVSDPSLEVLGGYGSVAVLPDGRLVARSGARRLVLVDADGKFIRRLFPPEE